MFSLSLILLVLPLRLHRYHTDTFERPCNTIISRNINVIIIPQQKNWKPKPMIRIKALIRRYFFCIFVGMCLFLISTYAEVSPSISWIDDFNLPLTFLNVQALLVPSHRGMWMIVIAIVRDVRMKKPSLVIPAFQRSLLGRKWLQMHKQISVSRSVSAWV